MLVSSFMFSVNFFKLGHMWSVTKNSEVTCRNLKRSLSESKFRFSHYCFNDYFRFLQNFSLSNLGRLLSFSQSTLTRDAKMLSLLLHTLWSATWFSRLNISDFIRSHSFFNFLYSFFFPIFFFFSFWFFLIHFFHLEGGFCIKKAFSHCWHMKYV